MTAKKDMENPASALVANIAPRPGLTANRLTPQELENYHRDGFVVPRFRLSQDEVTRLRGLILRLVAANPRFVDFLMQGPHVPGNKMQDLKSFPGWMEFAAHSAILDMIEQIVGPDIILRGTAVFYKRAGEGPATAWHRDALGAQHITPLVATHVWIAASDSFIDNACLRFIPGSHDLRTIGTHRHEQFEERHADGSVGPALVEGEYDETNAVDLELEAGQMIIFDVFAAHASRPNSGTRERASYALRFMPATSFYDHDSLGTREYGNDTRPLILVRGQNRGGSDLRRGHPTFAYG